MGWLSITTYTGAEELDFVEDTKRAGSQDLVDILKLSILYMYFHCCIVKRGLES